MSLPADRPLFCLVTDRRRLGPGDEADACDRLVAQVRAAAAAGVHLVHVRERDLAARPLATLVDRLVAATRGTATTIVVNDRLDVALACGAGGVHLRADSIDAARARAIAPPGFVIGRSIHEPSEAERPGADYLIFGSVFATASKPDRAAAGVDALAAAAARGAAPVLAIGGLTIARASVVARAGAAGLAAIGLFLPPYDGAPDLDVVVARARRAFDTSRTLV